MPPNPKCLLTEIFTHVYVNEYGCFDCCDPALAKRQRQDGANPTAQTQCYPSAQELAEMTHEELLAHKADHGLAEAKMDHVPDHHIAHHQRIDTEATSRGGYQAIYEEYLAGRGDRKGGVRSRRHNRFVLDTLDGITIGGIPIMDYGKPTALRRKRSRR